MIIILGSSLQGILCFYIVVNLYRSTFWSLVKYDYSLGGVKMVVLMLVPREGTAFPLELGLPCYKEQVSDLSGSSTTCYDYKFPRLTLNAPGFLIFRYIVQCRIDHLQQRAYKIFN